MVSRLVLTLLACSAFAFGQQCPQGFTLTGGKCVGGPTFTVASGSVALGTSSIASGACASVATATATGALTTDKLLVNAQGNISSVTGFIPATSGTLTIYPPWLTAGQVNVLVCNFTSDSLTPAPLSLSFWVLR